MQKLNLKYIIFSCHIKGHILKCIHMQFFLEKFNGEILRVHSRRNTKSTGQSMIIIIIITGTFSPWPNYPIPRPGICAEKKAFGSFSDNFNFSMKKASRAYNFVSYM